MQGLRAENESTARHGPVQPDPTGADVRVIILSNLSEPGTIERVKPYNIIGYLIKADTTPREVVAKVRSIFV